MRPFILFVLLAITTTACGCLPNPQSEWVTSEGGEQRSTLSDETFQQPATGCCCATGPDFAMFANDSSDWLPMHVHVANPHVGHGLAHFSHASIGGSAGHSHRR